MAEEDIINLTSLIIEPVTTLLAEGVCIKADFECIKSDIQVSWTISYIIDDAGKKIVIELLHTPLKIYKKGKNTEIFKISSLAVDDTEKKNIDTLGILSLSAIDKSLKEQFSINMMTQISTNKKGETTKTILSPLE